MKQSSHNIVYLDETRVNQNYTVGRCWTDTASYAVIGINLLTGKGSHLFVLHDGTKEGFMSDCELIFQAKNNGDYQKQLNATMFEEWFRDEPLPNIKPHSAIFMDNTPYHSDLLQRNCTSSWKKADLRN